MCYIFKFEIIVKHVDAGINQSHIGRKFHVRGIKHIGEQSQVVVVTVLHHRIVLVSKFYLFLLCANLYRTGQQIGIASLHTILNAFARQHHTLVCLGIFMLRLTDSMLVLPET